MQYLSFAIYTKANVLQKNALKYSLSIYLITIES